MDGTTRVARGRRLGRVMLAVAVLALAAPIAVLAAGAIDQEQPLFGASKALIGTDEWGPDVRQAQVFMAGITGDLDQVDLPIRVVGDPACRSWLKFGPSTAPASRGRS